MRSCFAAASRTWHADGMEARKHIFIRPYYRLTKCLQRLGETNLLFRSAYWVSKVGEPVFGVIDVVLLALFDRETLRDGCGFIKARAREEFSCKTKSDFIVLTISLAFLFLSCLVLTDVLARVVGLEGPPTVEEGPELFRGHPERFS